MYTLPGACPALFQFDLEVKVTQRRLGLIGAGGLLGERALQQTLNAQVDELAAVFPRPRH